MSDRVRIYKSACSCESFISTTKTKNEDLPVFKQREALQKLQQQIIKGADCLLPAENFKPTRLQEDHLPTRHTFFLDAYKATACLPLKTGTTNWQRALGALRFVKNGKPQVDPAGINSTDAFKLLPRYHPIYDSSFSQAKRGNIFKNCQANGLQNRVKSSSYLRFINVRHPFSRLFSAWRQKFATEFRNRKAYD